jgi:hypothetical protein
VVGYGAVYGNKLFYVRIHPIQLLVDCLFTNNLLPSRDIDSALHKVVCNIADSSCTSKECHVCKDRIAHTCERLTACVLRFWQWERLSDDSGFVNTRCVQVRVHVTNVRNEY